MTEEEFCEEIGSIFSKYGNQIKESVFSPTNWALWGLDGGFSALNIYKQITEHIPLFKTNSNNRALVNISDSVNYQGGRGGVRRISKAKLLKRNDALGRAYKTQNILNKVSKGLLILNGGVSFITEYNRDSSLSVKEKIVNSSVEAAWSMGSAVAIGAAVGSVIPGAGTVVGAVAGFVVGTAASVLVDGIVKTKWFEGGTKSVMDYAKQGANWMVDKVSDFGNKIGDAFAGITDFVFG